MTTNYQPGVRVSEYILEDRIGSGSFGEVWRACHHVWKDDKVAIKLPTEPAYVRQLQREGLVVHGLRHPNIVGVKGLDPYAEIPYLVMELVNGPSLRQVVDDHPKGMPIDVVLRIMRGILSAIIAAHEAGVLHRDLKPGNVLLNLDGAALADVKPELVKLSDFGLGSGAPDMLRSIAQSASIERDDRLVGTLAYMAPELRDGKKQADVRSDLYSIGVMLFEMLTGERPVGAELPSTLRADVPTGLDEIFRRLYARHDRRYENAEAVLRDLTALTAAPQTPRRVPAVKTHTVPPVPRSERGGACSACGREVEPFDQFCTHCGRQLVDAVRKCPGCGAFPGPHDRYCIFCGLKLPDVE